MPWPASGPRRSSSVDEGEACVSGQANEAHDVEVDPGVCLSSSCDEVVEANCTATLEGTTLTVRSDITVSRSKKNQCTLDCGSASATCETPPLPEGQYTVVYGDATAELTVPVAMRACVGSTS